MRQNITARKVGGRWYDVFVSEDESVTFRQIRDLRPEWPAKYAGMREGEQG